MKNKNVLSMLICLVMLSNVNAQHASPFPPSSSSSQQWLPANANISTAIYRVGNIGLGSTTPPQSSLHIVRDGGSILSGPIDKPIFDIEGNVVESDRAFHIRLDKTYTEGPSNWAIDGDNNLNFLKEKDGRFYRKLSLSDYGARVFGKHLSVGTSGEQINLGYNPVGHYLAMGYRPGNATTFLSAGAGVGGAIFFSDGTGNLSIATKDGGIMNIADNTKMMISSQGNVGIGTNTPLAKLHLSDPDKKTVALRLDAERPWDITADTDGDDSELTFSYSETTPFMRIKTNGRIAIGTDNTPENLDGGTTDLSAYRLYVEGGILTKEVRVRELWADYVFEKDYNLLPLETVENFINKNGHLPNTPSARDVAAQGINLGAATANQQEKIEEIYLHLIEMNKRLEVLEAENAALRAERK